MSPRKDVGLAGSFCGRARTQENQEAETSGRGNGKSRADQEEQGSVGRHVPRATP